MLFDVYAYVMAGKENGSELELVCTVAARGWSSAIKAAKAHIVAQNAGKGFICSDVDGCGDIDVLLNGKQVNLYWGFEAFEK